MNTELKDCHFELESLFCHSALEAFRLVFLYWLWTYIFRFLFNLFLLICFLCYSCFLHRFLITLSLPLSLLSFLPSEWFSGLAAWQSFLRTWKDPASILLVNKTMETHMSISVRSSFILWAKKSICMGWSDPSVNYCYAMCPNRNKFHSVYSDRLSWQDLLLCWLHILR